MWPHIPWGKVRAVGVLMGVLNLGTRSLLCESFPLNAKVCVSACLPLGDHLNWQQEDMSHVWVNHAGCGDVYTIQYTVSRAPNQTSALCLIPHQHGYKVVKYVMLVNVMKGWAELSCVKLQWLREFSLADLPTYVVVSWVTLGTACFISVLYQLMIDEFLFFSVEQSKIVSFS